MQTDYSRIGLGTVQFGLDYGISNTSGQTSLKQVREILDLAAEYGVDTLDTALAYGESEAVLGKMKTSGFKIVSKFPDSRKPVSMYLDESLSRLNRKSIYGYMAHDVSSVIQNPGVYAELKELKAQGKVTKIGYSFYDPKDLLEALEKDLTPDIIQVPYNFFDRRFEKYFPELKELDIEIHTRSCFLQGLFFTRPENLDVFFDPVKQALTTLQNQYANTTALAAGLIKFCLANELIDRVIIGVNNAEQLSSNFTTKAEVPDLSSFDMPESIINPSKWPKI